MNAPHSLDRIVTSADECILDKASYNDRLSSKGMEENIERFHATVDQVQFLSAVEIIETVLEAHGYSLNMENVLSCLDYFRLGMKVKIAQKSTGQEPPTGKSYAPLVHFQLPSKKRVGPLLQKFYKEVEQYEKEIDRLQKIAIGGSGDEAGQSNSALAKETRQLRRENKSLQEKIAVLIAELAEVKTSLENASQAIEDGNYLPPDLRIATVHSISLKERLVTLRDGQTSFNVPTGLLDTIPAKGEKCLAAIENGSVTGVFLYEGTSRAPTIRLAEVLHVDGDLCKVRDEDRRNWLISAGNPLEQSAISSLRRGDRILVYFHDDVIIRFHGLSDGNNDDSAWRIAEEIVSKQARDEHHIRKRSDKKDSEKGAR